MLYSTLVKSMLRRLYGEPPESAGDGEGSGLVLVADGVGGLYLLGASLKYAMARAGRALTVRVVEWGHGFGRWHRDLADVDNHRVQAAAIASEAEAFRARWPAAPVFLVGKSGGAGLVVRALEALPEGSVERAVLLAPALSPGYDLAPALAAVRREMVVFWSPLDVFILGLGTGIFGTVDRVHSAGAGLVGFRTPPPGDAARRSRYAKLRQVRWHPRMVASGYLGGHVGPDGPGFLRKFVVPLLVAGEPAGESAAVSSRPGGAPIT